MTVELVINSVFIDANILIYAREIKSPLSKKAVELLESLIIQDITGVITPYVLSEIHRLYLMHYSEALAEDYCKEILEMQNIEIVDLVLSEGDVKDVFGISTRCKLKTFSAYHAFYCKKLDIKHIATFNKDFNRVPWVKIYRV